MLIKKGIIYQLTIDGIAYGGKGFSKVENFVIFVDQTAPGDVIEAKIFKKRRNYAEGKIIKFLEYSKYRVKAPCDYSGLCGGCKWQFLDYNQQLIYKHKHVSESIEHISLIKDIEVNPIIPSRTIFGYRNKMEFSCSDRRWLLEKEIDSSISLDKSLFGIGLHVPGTFYKILDISSCLLQPSLGNEILNDIRNFIKVSNEPPYGLKSHKGFWRSVVFRHSKTYNHWMINIVTANLNIKVIQPLADLLVDKYENIVSIINTVTANKSGVSIGEPKTTLAGQNTICEQIGSYDFNISADSFFQTNTRGAQKLYDIIKEYADLSGKELLLDLYCGTGTISAYLSGMVKKIIGIDIVKDAISDARNNCDLNNISNCDFILGDVKRKILNIDVIPDVVIIDPPRMGMHKKIVKEILSMSPNKIIYVSCNPTTLARDLFKLKESYKIENIQPIDMFPHTFHIETVVKMSKKIN